MGRNPAITNGNVDPLVSVIMAVRNEERFIGRSLSSIFAQTYPHHRLEVLVADGMSTDRTREVIDDVRAGQRLIRLTVLNNIDLTASAGLNLALNNSFGEIIIRADAKSQLATDYVRNCVDLLKKTGAENVGGWRSPVGDGLFGPAIAAAITSSFGVGGDRTARSFRQEWTDTVYLGAWQRKTFERFGQFDEELARNQDDEFNYRLRKLGGRILCSGSIRSTYCCRTSLGQLWRQYFDFGFWKVRVLQKHPRQMRWRQFVPPSFVCSLVVLGLLAPFSALSRVLLFTLLALYGLANVAATLIVDARARTRQLLVLPIVFVLLHLAYGSGFLVGLMRFSVFALPAAPIKDRMRGRL